MLEEFKKFALKGNVVDLAIGEEDLSLTRTVRVSRNGCTVPICRADSACERDGIRTPV